jgi:hypothetical protein
VSKGEYVIPPPTEKQEEAIKYLAGFLSEQGYRAGSKMLDFLILTNGGAAVACLGMIASSSPHANDYAVKLLLAAFVIGLALAGWLTVRGFRYTMQMLLDFHDTVDRMRAGTETWEALGRIFDMKIAKRFKDRGVIIGSASLGMFAIGAAGALIWLLCPAH